MKEDLENKVLEVFRDVFGKPDLFVSATTTAADISGWDSLTHMTLITALESYFSIIFSFEEVRDFNNVGDIINLISKKLS